MNKTNKRTKTICDEIEFYSAVVALKCFFVVNAFRFQDAYNCRNVRVFVSESRKQLMCHCFFLIVLTLLMKQRYTNLVPWIE